MFLKNAWYLAAWSHEVPPGKPLGRKILDQAVVFYRTKEGDAAALEDRCPHRFAALSLGIVAEGRLRCAYHGLEFDSTGACAANPHGPIPKAAKVRGFPLLERWGALWIWVGEPSLAQEDKLPDLAPYLAETDGKRVSHDYYHVRANYQLLNDNILDLSHIEYLHPGSFGTPAVGAGSVTVTREDLLVRSRRVIPNDPLTPLIARHMGGEGKLFERTLDVAWHAPSILTLDIDIRPAEDPGAVLFSAPGVHIFTPETAATTHYFMSGRLFGDPDRREDVFDPISAEDIPMLESQQERLGDVDFWDMGPALLSVDKAGVWARRTLQQMIEAEG